MLDYLAIFKKLNEKGIRYIVVGGIAVNLYGMRGSRMRQI